MKSEINVEWLDEMAFKTEINGHKIVIDADSKVGGSNQGPRPKPLLLLSLAGCTGMDVISILKKMRVEVEKFNVKVESNMTEEHPKHYESIHLIYEFWGDNLSQEKLEKAITLSQERYCGVSHSLKKAMKLSYELKVYE